MPAERLAEEGPRQPAAPGKEGLERRAERRRHVSVARSVQAGRRAVEDLKGRGKEHMDERILVTEALAEWYSCRGYGRSCDFLKQLAND